MNRRSFLRLGGLTAFGLGLGFAPEYGLWLSEAFAARGSTPEESARARAIVDRLYRGGATTSLRGAGVYTIEPGGFLVIKLNGYCLDHQFGVPKQGEPLAYRPMSKYIAPELRDLYVRVMRKVSAGDPAGADVQKIVWAIRTPARGSFTEGLSSADQRFINSAMPGGVGLLQRAHRPAEYISGSGGSGDGGGRGGRAGEDPLGALLPHLLNQLPFNIRQHSNDLMNQLHGRNAQKPMPGSQYKYSMLTTSGVAAKSEGAGGLAVHSIIVNGSDASFVYDSTDWVLESPRDVQAVALPQLTKGTAINAYAGGDSSRGRQQPENARQRDEPGQDGMGGQEGQNGEMLKEFTNVKPRGR